MITYVNMKKSVLFIVPWIIRLVYQSRAGFIEQLFSFNHYARNYDWLIIHHERQEMIYEDR